MELPITAEQEAYLLELARHLSKSPSEILTQAALSLFDSDRRFRGVTQRAMPVCSDNHTEG